MDICRGVDAVTGREDSMGQEEELPERAMELAGTARLAGGEFST